MERAEELVGVRVGLVEFGLDAKLSPEDRSSCDRRRGNKAGGAKKKDGQLAQ